MLTAFIVLLRSIGLMCRDTKTKRLPLILIRQESSLPRAQLTRHPGRERG